MNIVFSDPKILVIAAILSVSSVISILDYVGFLPRKISRILTRNKLQPTLDVLKELGVDVDKHRRVNIASEIPEYFPSSEVVMQARGALDKITIRRKIMVGSINVVPSDKYIDLMGASTEPQSAAIFARLMASYWKGVLVDPKSVKSPVFDFVVCPKGGSPILAYEFSKLFNKPLVLHCTETKFKTEKEIFQSRFDARSVPGAGAVALIVDDSTTGGNKVLRAVDDLRRFGYVSSDCLVVFEPVLKNAKDLLASKGVNLHSIVKT
ncbi:phosphoribosyltransferase [Bradyrhizobium sp. HKCCYLRH2060]|uniref:phosphoribosyltransferase n=1 Tax=Bradyrhizobium TaxID=374 RepID=UPI00291710C9|nr:phosphoribosyltransferase [Bradyrhizobium sp. SZCCHNR3003]